MGLLSLVDPTSMFPVPGTGKYLAAAAASLLILPFLLTYALTSIKAYRLSNGDPKNGAREPPPAPYVVPGLANTFAFASDPEGFLKKMM